MDLKVKNYAVGCIEKILEESGTALGVCSCHVCRTDITAIVLNKLGYSLYEACEDYDQSKLEQYKSDYEKDIITKIKSANEIVSKNPKHDDKSTENLVVRNYMEDCAIKVIEKMMQQNGADMAKINEVTARALNILPVKYVVSKKGELYTKISTMETQFNVDIMSAAATAMAELSH